MDKLDTGDIILYHCKKGIFGRIIQYFTMSGYSHIGVVLKNPQFTEKPLLGMFLWESSDEKFPDSEDGKCKIGVEIVELEKVINDVYKNDTHDLYYRKLFVEEPISQEKLKEIHNIVHNKPYDFIPTDWLEALIGRDNIPQKTDRFWCSALVGFIYTKLGLLPENTDWSIMRPSDFSEKSNIKLLNGSYLDKEIYLSDIISENL